MNARLVAGPAVALERAVQFRLLGRFEASVDGSAVALGGPRPRAVLALLLLEHGRPVTADRLLDAIWAGEPPASSTSTLHAYLARLRKALGPGGRYLATTGHGYLVDPAADVDVWRFEELVDRGLALTDPQDAGPAANQLRAALSLWRGDLLADGLGDQEWVLPHAGRLRERRMCALAALAQAELNLGHLQAAILLLQDAVGEQPHREEAVRLLMVALYRAGRQTDATGAYLDHRRLLAAEFGVEPSQALRDLHTAVLRHSEELSAPPPGRRAVRSLPHRNPRFTGRQELLGRASAELSTGGPVVLSGLGGCGKSAAALEIAHSYQGPAWWVPAESEAALTAALSDLARACTGRTDEPASAVWQQVNMNPPPLVVFDNAADPATLSPYLPPDGSAVVLVTSRNPVWGAVGTVISVGPFNAADAQAFLRTRTGDREPDGPARLAEELGRLPLAMEQAAAYIEQTGMSIAEYLRLFQKSCDDLLLRAPPHDHPAAVGTTWRLAFEQLGTTAPRAAELLNVLAFLSPDGIQLSLIRLLFRGPDPDLDIADAVGHLRRFSLVDRDGSALRVHRLVQAAVRARLNRHTRGATQSAVTRILEAADPGDADQPESWPAWGTLAPHVLTAAVLAAETPPASADVDNLIRLIRRAARYLRRSASPRAGTALLAVAISLTSRQAGQAGQLGLLHSELGDLLDAAGDLNQARAEHTDAVALLETVLSPDDHQLALARTRLGHVMNCAGDPRGAMSVHRRALATLRDHDDHRGTVGALVDLGYASWAAGELAASAEAFDEALYRCPPSLDSQLHADAIAGLGMVRQDQGDLGGALALQEQALAELTALYGDIDHPEPAQAYDKIGFVLRLLGETDRAVRAHRSAEAMLTATLGPDDPRVAMALTNLGLALLQAGDRAAAVAAQRRAEILFSAAYGPAHPHSKMAAERLLVAQSDHPTAEARGRGGGPPDCKGSTSGA